MRIVQVRPGGFELFAAGLAVPAEERQALSEHIAESAEAAAEICDPLIERMNGL